MTDKFLNAFVDETNVSYTENGAKTNATTKSAMLDAFGALGNSIYMDNEDIKKIFVKAYNEDRELALRYLFYLRDVRGGQGMRKAFRVISIYLADNYPNDVINNIDNIPYFGRYDDLFYIYNNCFSKEVKSKIIDYIRNQLKIDLQNYANKNYKDISLLAKWMPSINTSSKDTIDLANKIRVELNMKPSTYRKILSKLRKALNIVEVNLCAKSFDKIDYSAVPSKAASKYSNAFYTHDELRYIDYLTELELGNAKINAGALFPYDIVSKVYESRWSKNRVVSDKVYSAQWNALPNYFEGRDETGICVVDVSGSMMGVPIRVALSLGLYCADKCKCPYKDHFITFSRYPELQHITGNTLMEKLDSMQTSAWGMNTNLEKVFLLILEIAMKNHLKQDEIPNKIYIISDMQFDKSATDPNCKFMDNIKKLYREANYEVPSVVYWNVSNYTTGIYHQTINDTDFCMVSGYSPSLFQAVIDGTDYEEVKTEDGKVEVKQKLDPIKVMMTAIMSERYNRVWIK